MKRQIETESELHERKGDRQMKNCIARMGRGGSKEDCATGDENTH